MLDMGNSPGIRAVYHKTQGRSPGRPSLEALDAITCADWRAGPICTTMPKQFQGIVVAF